MIRTARPPKVREFSRGALALRLQFRRGTLQPTRVRGRRPSAEWRLTRIPVAIACKDWRQVERLIRASNRPRGFFIHTQDFASVGTELLLHIRLPDANVVELACTVVYAVSPVSADALGTTPGFGVRIDSGQESDLVLLSAMASSNDHEC